MAIFMGIEFNLQIALDNMVILTVLILLIQEHTWQLSFFFFFFLYHFQFPTFLFSSFQSIDVSPPWLSYYQIFQVFYFCFVLLIVHYWGRATKVCMLVLYPATLQNSFISSYAFFSLVETLGFSIYSIMSSANGDSFTSSLPFD